MICLKLSTTSQLFLACQAHIDIKANEELTFDYEWTDDGECLLTLCYCGSPNCHNYIQKRDENVKSEMPDYQRISEIYNQPKVLKTLKYYRNKIKKKWQSIINNSESKRRMLSVWRILKRLRNRRTS